ncbi:MAG TPA: MFS transporter [Candidatus Dormibacteraeota bacterium]|nr:MFS transporter [Candidatus Dormibacteraeota bacterium]
MLQPFSRQKLPAASRRILALLALSVFINYVDRANLSIAGPLLKGELHLSAAQLGLLFSAFFWTYTFLQLPVGWLIDRYDVKWILAGGFFLWSLATSITGLLHGFAALFAIRLILGMGEAVAYPAYGNILARYFPETHRGIANAVINAGQVCGPAFATFGGGLLIGKFGWRPLFLTLGLISMLWLPVWFRWMPRRPPEPQKRPTKPFAQISEVLTHRSAWGTCFGLFCGNYFLYLLLTLLPFYLIHDRHFSLAATAKIGGVAFLLVGSGALLSGRFSDTWISSGATPTLVRKSCLCVGLLSASTLLLLSSISPNTLSIILLLAACFFFGLGAPHNFAVSQTLAGPTLAGTWTGLQNFIGNFAGIVAPPITGYIVDRTGNFFWAFVLTTAIAWTGALVWLFLVGPVEQVTLLPLVEAEA